MVSVTHGRPTMISERVASAVPLPEISSSQLPGERKEFFVKSVQLYEITHRIVLALYGGKYTRDESRYQHPTVIDDDIDDLDIVVPLDRSLNKWVLGLPDHLKWNQLPELADESTRREAFILHIRLVC